MKTSKCCAEHIQDLETLTQDRMSLDEFANAHEYFGSTSEG